MDLQSLVLDEVLAHGIDRPAAVVDGPAVRLNAKSTELMTLVVHELATNAIKFGALSQPQSQLRVLWWFKEFRRAAPAFRVGREGCANGGNEELPPGLRLTGR